MAATADTTGLGDLVAALTRRFEAEGIATPQQDARLLVGGLLGLDLTALVLNAGRRLEDRDVVRVITAADRRCCGEPVHRILGYREFRGLDLQITSATLEPRPDTETLVDTVLPIGRDVARRTGQCRILDLGTGTGAIGLALVAGIAEATCVATDICDDALAVARDNAQRLGLTDRFAASRSDWFEQVDGVFDLVVSNPPYIRSADIADLDREVREHDPLVALDGGADGLDAYRAIADGATNHLRPGGHVAVEIGFDQRRSVLALFEARSLACCLQVTDLAGCDRVLVLQAD